MKAKIQFIIAALLSPALAFGWGSYGHQQVNDVAIKILSQSPLGQCFQKNRDLIVRLSVTPDLEWKMGSQDYFALNVYNIVNGLPHDPQNTYLLLKLKKILEKDGDAKNPILTTQLRAALGKQPGSIENLKLFQEAMRKAGKLGSLSYEVLKKKAQVDRVEHSLHYWGADAYSAGKSGDAITSLVSSPNFDRDVLPSFTQLLKQNSQYISQVDACKPLGQNIHRDVIQHGTAPWRAHSLLKQAVENLSAAIKEKNPAKFQHALLLLGTMGHYVGDMGQPFHATLNYDGQGTGAATLGIHSTYETKILERYAKNNSKEGSRSRSSGVKQDKETKLWLNFSATESKVFQYAQDYQSSFTKIKDEQKQTIPLIYKLVADGYDFIPPLLAAFKEARLADDKFQQLDLPFGDCDKKSRGPSTPIHAITVDQFMKASFKVPGSDKVMSTVESAEKRMGEAAAVLAELWGKAEKLSQASAENINNLCGTINFSRENTITNYPFPDHHTPQTDFNKYAQSEKQDELAPTLNTTPENEENDGADDSGQGELFPKDRRPTTTKNKK